MLLGNIVLRKHHRDAAASINFGVSLLFQQLLGLLDDIGIFLLDAFGFLNNLVDSFRVSFLILFLLCLRRGRNGDSLAQISTLRNFNLLCCHFISAVLSVDLIIIRQISCLK